MVAYLVLAFRPKESPWSLVVYVFIYVYRYLYKTDQQCVLLLFLLWSFSYYSK